MQGKSNGNSTLRIINPSTTYISETVKIGKNVTIYPNNYIDGDTEIGDNVVLLPGNFIKNSIIGEGSQVFNSVIEDSRVGKSVKIGPFAHLRPESEIEDEAKIGNFVEIKKSKIDKKTKVSHLSYVGDAEVGKNVNIGCGVVFVNYNGKIKSKSEVGDYSFVGSSVNLIAPVKIGKRVFICAGTTIDKDVPDQSFVIGRSKMNIKQDRAKFYLKGE